MKLARGDAVKKSRQMRENPHKMQYAQRKSTKMPLGPENTGKQNRDKRREKGET
jgi:hypothetical protein